MHFKLSDQVRLAWAQPGETPTLVEKPQKGLKTCSVIAACSVYTGELLFEIGEKFQRKEDVVRFIGRICEATPPGKKVAILMDNAASHKARVVKTFMERIDATACFNVAYHPQWNGIEHVFSDVRARYRKRLTALKLASVDDIDLRAEVTATFTETSRRIVIDQCMRGWRQLLRPEGVGPDSFQERTLVKEA